MTRLARLSSDRDVYRPTSTGVQPGAECKESKHPTSRICLCRRQRRTRQKSVLERIEAVRNGSRRDSDDAHCWSERNRRLQWKFVREFCVIFTRWKAGCVHREEGKFARKYERVFHAPLRSRRAVRFAFSENARVVCVLLESGGDR